MMSEAIDFVIVENLGWTLFHSLWQFTLIGIAVWLFLTALQCRSSAIRYRVLSCGLLSMITVSCITFFTLANETARNIRSAELVSVSTDVGLPAPHPHEIDDNAVSTFQSPIVSEPFVARPDPRRSGYRISGEQRSVTGSGISHEPAALSWAHWRGVVLAVVEPWIPMIMFVWMAGVAVLSLRPLVGWRSAGRLRSVGLSEAPQRVVEIVGRLARQMRITKALTVVESALVEIPTVVGWLRPVILMPASAITGLPNEQLEAVIAHELAHIRRHDYLVNAVQVFLETVFFYHPALWWVSMSMRDEREKCCDAVVVGMTGDPAEYVKMLLRVEESRGMSSVSHPALSAGGGRLVDRIRLLTHPPVRRGSNGGFYSVLLLAVSVLGCGLWFAAIASPFVPPATASDSATVSESTNKISSLRRAMQLDPLYVTEPQESVNQLRAIKTWKQFVEQPGLTKGQQVFAWWRIGSLAAYNFDVDRGESADVTLAAKAFQRVHAIGGDLISRETLNTATVYGTLGGEPADRALRLAESYRWLFTRTDQMIAASVPEINHNGHCIDDASMPGGMKLDTAAKKRGFLATELARSRQALTGRITDEIKYSRDPTAVKTLLDSIREIADDKQVQQWAALAAMVVADDLDRRGVHDNSLAQASLARGTADDSPRAAIQFSGFPELATDEQVGKSWGIAKLIARYSWAGDDCKLMAAEFLEAWTKTREEVPDYIRDDLDRYVARRVYQLQKNLDNDQYLTAEMKDAVVTLNYFNNARSLLRLADHQWPDEKVWRGNLDAYDQLMKDLCRRLETKGDIIPVWASESLVTTAAGIFDGFRLEFFHPRGHHILSEVDRKRLVAILDEQVASTESLFAKQQTGASGKKSESPNVPGNTKILEPIGNSLYHVIHNYLDSVALEGIQENGLSREFTARHESMMNALSTRFTALHQTEWKARQDWVTDRLVDTEREAFLELPFEPLPKRARRLDSLAVMAPPQVTSAKGSSRTSAATTIDKAVARLLTAAGQPTWTLRSVDQQPTVIVDGFVGYRITLRRTWKEYTSPPQQKAEFNEDTGPFEMKHEDWEFVLIPADPKPVATNLASKIPWQKSNSPFFTRDVCMGEGQGFVWYTRGTLFGQEFVREKLKLTGGEDRIGLLIDGIQVEDTNTMTANSCQSAVAHFGDAAVVAIENAVANSNDPNATLKLIASLRYIQTDKSTQLMLNLYRSAQDDVRTAAAYALVHQPFRPAAKEAYFDMLRRHQRVYESCRACRQFHWKDALPLMNDLIDRPANLRELSFTIPTRRTLQGNPIPQVLLDAQEAIRSAGDNIDAEVERQLQILVDSDDSEAARLIAIELATYVRKGSSRRTNEIGIQILKLRPRQPTIEYLQGLVEVLPPNDRQEVEKLIQQVTKH